MARRKFKTSGNIPELTNENCIQVLRTMFKGQQAIHSHSYPHMNKINDANKKAMENTINAFIENNPESIHAVYRNGGSFRWAFKLVRTYHERHHNNAKEYKMIHQIVDKNGELVKEAADGNLFTQMIITSQYGCSFSPENCFRPAQDKSNYKEITRNIRPDLQKTLELTGILAECRDHVIRFYEHLNKDRVDFMVENYDLIKDRYFNDEDKNIYNNALKWLDAEKTQIDPESLPEAQEALRKQIFSQMNIKGSSGHNYAQNPQRKMFPRSEDLQSVSNSVAALTRLCDGLMIFGENESKIEEQLGLKYFRLQLSHDYLSGAQSVMEATLEKERKAAKNAAKFAKGKGGAQSAPVQKPMYLTYRSMPVTSANTGEEYDELITGFLATNLSTLAVGVKVDALSSRSNNNDDTPKKGAKEEGTDSGKKNMHTVKVNLLRVAIIQHGVPHGQNNVDYSGAIEFQGDDAEEEEEEMNDEEEASDQAMADIDLDVDAIDRAEKRIKHENENVEV